jgi:hypothetical protein
MNVKRLTYLIKNPYSVTTSDISGLKELKENYSYCSTYNILYLLALAKSNHILFDEELKKNSINANDRIKLFYILNKNTSEKEHNDELDNIFEEGQKNNLSDLNVEQKIDDLIESESELLEKSISEVKDQTIETELEIDVLSHIVETFFENEIESSKTNSKKLTLQDESILETKKPIDLSVDDLSFSEWLKFKQGKVNIVTNKLRPVEPKLTKKEIDNLLNKFIEEEPKISRPKKEFFNPVKNAKHSLDESTVLVSETLAKIYWMQKNYDKAIKAYEQLSLQNPKKSVFFANQIKKIKKEIN